MFFVPDQPSKLLYVVGDDPVIKGLSLLQLWKKSVTFIPTPRRGPTRLLFNGSEASVNPDHARVLWSLI